MRQAEKEKKDLDPNSVRTRPGQENSEKNRKKNQKINKTNFWHYFLPKWDEIGREREKKKFNSRILFLPNPSLKIPNKKQ